jgi:hypothetical protein
MPGPEEGRSSAVLTTNTLKDFLSLLMSYRIPACSATPPISSITSSGTHCLPYRVLPHITIKTYSSWRWQQQCLPKEKTLNIRRGLYSKAEVVQTPSSSEKSVTLLYWYTDTKKTTVLWKAEVSYNYHIITHTYIYIYIYLKAILIRKFHKTLK